MESRCLICSKTLLPATIYSGVYCAACTFLYERLVVLAKDQGIFYRTPLNRLVQQVFIAIKGDTNKSTAMPKVKKIKPPVLLTTEELKALPYQLYLRTEHWRVTRLAALRRAQRRCNRCGSKRKLQVHHKTYKNLGRELPADLEVLCRICHAAHHSLTP